MAYSDFIRYLPEPGLFVETRGRNYAVLLKISLRAGVSIMSEAFLLRAAKKTKTKHMRSYN